MHSSRLFIVVLQELHCLPNCLHVLWSELQVVITSPSFLTLHLLVSEIVVFQELHCLLQCLLLLLSLKSIRILSFVLIACWVSELYIVCPSISLS